ncbi:MAG: Na/Pi cotransporter family protein [Spirochaetia bacterium]
MIYGFLKIAGSLGLFLYGMNVMSSGIQKTAGDKLQSIMNFMTTNRFMAVLTGFIITSIIQSSSATTVMVVSFVNAQLLNLTQAIGVIMGANIGTTITGWIVAILGFKVKLTALALPAIGFGIPLILSKKFGNRDLGEVIIGFGLLFLGLSFLKDSVPDIRENPEVLEFITNFMGQGIVSFLLFVITGTLLTIIIQSSSASMAITITMAAAGWIDFSAAAAMVIGENIGTTITANVASIGTSVNARRSARAHALFNMLGVVWMAVLFDPFQHMINFIVPGDVFAAESVELVPQHLAMFHTMFNIINTIIFIPFVKQIAWLVERTVFEKPDKEERPQLRYISTALQSTPELSLMEAKYGVARMAKTATTMFDTYRNIFRSTSKKDLGKIEELRKQEDITDQMQEEISSFLAECSLYELNERSNERLNAMIRIVGELESIGDSIFNLSVLWERVQKRNKSLDASAYDELEPYILNVKKFLDFIRNHLDNTVTQREIEEAVHLEDTINNQRNALKKSSRNRIKSGAPVKGELLYMDIVQQLERIGDYSLNIAEALGSVH